MTLLQTPHSISLPCRPRLQWIGQGDPAGLPVLLLHGYGDTCRSFEPLLAAMPPTLRVLALTQRGHGDAEPGVELTLDALADDAAAFLAALGHDAALVVGHSMGSSVAQRLALRHPRRVRGLVLIGGFASLRGNPTVPGFLQDLARLTDPVDRDFVTSFQASMLASPMAEDAFAVLVDESCKMRADAWRGVFRCMLEDDHAEDELRRIEAPTLLVWGDRDAYISRRDQQVLQEGLPNARLVVHAGRGHSPHWEAPAAVAAEIAAFADWLLRRAGGAGASGSA